jgi:hypothetical protein
MNRIYSYNNTTSINKFSNDFSWINTVLLSMAMFSLAILTILGNTIVIYALQTDRHLRTVIYVDRALVLISLFSEKGKLILLCC